MSGKIIIFIGFFIFSHFNPLISQVNEEWVQRYNGPLNNNDFAQAISLDKFGNIYVTGYSLGIGTFTDYATIKYDMYGVQQWVQRYNGTGTGDSVSDVAYAIAVDDSCNVYVTGLSKGSGTDFDYVTIKYNSSGIQQWVQRYNGIGNSHDEANSIVTDDSCNVYVTGRSWGGSFISYDIATIKYNSSGIQQWVKKYNGTNNRSDEGNSIAVDAMGNVYVTGYSGSGSYTNDYVTIKYNSSGVQQWAITYNGPANNDDIAEAVCLDISGNIYVTGKSYGSGSSTDYATIKYDPSGVQLWVQRYNGPGNSYDVANFIVTDDSCNVYITGGSYGSGTTDDYATIKYDSAGVQQWVQRYNGPGNGIDIANSMAIDTYGNIYITGQSYGSGTFYDYATIKYNSSGNQQWIQRFTSPGIRTDIARSIAVDQSGNVYVTGESNSGDMYSDYATVKYSQFSSIKTVSNEIPEKYYLSQNYPNPFNPSTKIRFDLPKNGFTELKVLDITGREVQMLVNANLNAGSYEVDFNGTNLPSGMYFYQLKAESFIAAKKMIILK